MKTLDVFLSGELAGSLSQTSSGDLFFTYDDTYRSQSGATPLSLSMPLSSSRHKRRAALPFFQGLLPDSETALQAVGSHFGVSWRNPFALLEHLGRDVVGAVEILPGTPEPSADARDQESKTLSDEEVGMILRSVATEYETGTTVGERGGYFSVAGMQPKAALRRQGNQWMIPDAQHPTTHIIKPSLGAFPRIDLAEYMTMSVAKMLGLKVADCQLMEIDGLNCLVVERFDRESVDGKTERLHQEDCAQALSVLPSKKYQRLDGGPGLAAIAQLFDSFPHQQDRRQAARDFFEAVVFNTVAGCTDAHAKNYSLLLSGSRVTLAPLYDLVTYAGYWDRESPVLMAMSIDKEYRLGHISPSALAAEGERFGWGEDGHDLVHSMRERVGPLFEQVGETLREEKPDAAAFIEGLITGVQQLPLVLRGN